MAKLSAPSFYGIAWFRYTGFKNWRSFRAVSLFSVFVLILFSLSIQPTHAAGASLYVSPSSGTFTVGSTFTVSVYVNTGGQFVNAIDANLSFPADKLQVVSPDSGKSLIQVWTGQPTYSNTDGTLNFEGAVPTPGINTDAGLISTITFRVMQTGTASLQFGDSKVLLNDGYGTDALTETTNGIYTLVLPPPAGPIVTSPTDPDQTKWYNSNNAVLEWASSPDIQGFSYALDDNPLGVPSGVSEGMRTSVMYDHLMDGVHYFHIQALRNGEWGGVTTYAILTDTTPPAGFSISVAPRAETSDEQPVFSFETTDAASGMAYYDLKIVPLTPTPGAPSSGGQFFIETDSPYIQTLPYGDYDVYVRAYDNAGNYTQEVQRVVITKSVFEIIGSQGFLLGGFVIPWPYAGALALLILALLFYFFWRARRYHREIEEILESGAERHPDIAAKIKALHERRKEYSAHLKATLLIFALAISFAALLDARLVVNAQVLVPPSGTSSATSQGLSLDPPIVNLAPSSIANDQILYLGGWANIPGAAVLIHIEKTETGETFTGTATTGSDGNWFYSSPQFLDSGNYVAWAELHYEGQTSAPSARVDVAVEPTAIAIGNERLDYQDIYLILFILFALTTLLLIGFLVHVMRKTASKRAKLEEALRDAEESLRRGFAVLRRDLELELATIAKAKLKGMISEEEKDREEKLTRDLDDVSSYIGKEIWRVEEEEKKL